jgi:hypothetical protein
MAEVLNIIKYLCAAAAGAITGFSTFYVYSSVYSSKPSPLRRPLRILITGAAGELNFDVDICSERKGLCICLNGLDPSSRDAGSATTC